jgi:hypothetical protein
MLSCEPRLDYLVDCLLSHGINGIPQVTSLPRSSASEEVAQTKAAMQNIPKRRKLIERIPLEERPEKRLHSSTCRPEAMHGDNTAFLHRTSICEDYRRASREVNGDSDHQQHRGGANQRNQSNDALDN